MKYTTILLLMISNSVFAQEAQEVRYENSFFITASTGIGYNYDRPPGKEFKSIGFAAAEWLAIWDEEYHSYVGLFARYNICNCTGVEGDNGEFEAGLRLNASIINGTFRTNRWITLGPNFEVTYTNQGTEKWGGINVNLGIENTYRLSDYLDIVLLFHKNLNVFDSAFENNGDYRFSIAFRGNLSAAFKQ